MVSVVEGIKICIFALLFVFVLVFVDLYLSGHCCVVCIVLKSSRYVFLHFYLSFVDWYLSGQWCVLCGRKQDL